MNGKIYIGKTEFSIEKRFKEHCQDAFKPDKEHRPLYAAMRKYGIDHFHIELLEQTDNPEERERYWIEQRGSFKNGYNVTHGGDGRKYLDYDLIVAAYQKLGNVREVARTFNIDRKYAADIIRQRTAVLTSAEVNKQKSGQTIHQFDIVGNYINTFASAGDAARSVRPDNFTPGVISHITDVCKGRRKTAYGYVWSY